MFVVSAAKRPHLMWVPSSLLSKCYRSVVPVGVRGPSLRLSTNLHLMARLGMSGAILLLPPMPSSRVQG
jgi:hypothetical protein